MKAHKNWSYAPYCPPFHDAGDLYLCRVAPAPHAIHIEWLDPADLSDFRIYLRKRDQGDFTLAATTNAAECTLENLDTNTDYEFYVESHGKRSRTRLARTGASIDTVVNYLHPDDEAYAFSGRCLCSPSLVRLPDGALLASMDVFAGSYPQNLTLIFRSTDDGATWHYLSELFPCFWGKLFLHKGDLYMLSCSTEYGDLLIGKSTDGGATFCEPTVLLRGSNGKNGEAGCHKNPQPVIEFAGRLWNTMEYGAWGRGYHAAMVLSAPVDADLLDASSWSFSEPVKYDPAWSGVPQGPSTGNIEGCLLPKEDKLYNIMRYDMTRMTPNYGKVIAYKVNTCDPEAPLLYDHCIAFPANHSKFQMKFNPADGKYYSIASRIIDETQFGARNLLTLFVSDDAEHWNILRDLHDHTHEAKEQIGFQYVDFFIENNRICYLCRTAINGARNFHDANYSTFGTIPL